MEFIIELILEVFGEFLIEILLEFGWRSLFAPFFGTGTRHKLLASIFCVILGVVSGLLSLYFLPHHLVQHSGTRMVNLFLSPILVGLTMARFGRRREAANRTTSQLDTFTNGFLLAFSIALVRLIGGH